MNAISRLTFVALWIVSVPWLIWGGFHTPFTPNHSYPLGNVIELCVFTAIETFYLYRCYLRRDQALKMLMILLYALWVFLGWLYANGMTDMGVFPFIHSLWAIVSLVVFLGLSSIKLFNSAKISRNHENPA